MLLMHKVKLRKLTLAKNFEIEYLQNYINHDHCFLPPPWKFLRAPLFVNLHFKTLPLMFSHIMIKAKYLVLIMFYN